MLEDRLILKEEFYEDAVVKFNEACLKAKRLSEDKRFNNYFVMTEVHKMITDVTDILIIGSEIKKAQIKERDKEIRREYEKQLNFFDDDLFIEPLKDGATSLEEKAFKEKVEKAQEKRIKQAHIKQAELTAEILQRQDFDMKLDLLDDNDLEHFVNEITEEDAQVNNYELTKVRLRVKNMPEKPIKKELSDILKEMVVSNAIDNPWSKDEEFIKNQKILRDLNVFPTNIIFIFNEIHQDYEAKEIEKEIIEAANIKNNAWTQYRIKNKLNYK